MINDFNEIKNEKDRELYVQLRNILDNYFMYQINSHNEKDHFFHECECLDIYDELHKMFPSQLKHEVVKSGTSEIETIEYWINDNENHMLMHMMSLIMLQEQYNKRKQ